MKIRHIAILVSDLEQSIRFYINNFGFTEFKRFSKPGYETDIVLLQSDNIGLEIFQNSKAKPISRELKLGIRHITIETDNLNEKYKELKNKGIDIDEPIKGTTCTYCFLRDPDGIELELYEL